MCAILLSINPIHVENIMNGTKRYEFRKKACKRHVDKILIYSTNPIMRVVGEAEVKKLDVQMDWCDKYEFGLAAFCGAMAGFIDVFFAAVVVGAA